MFNDFWQNEVPLKNNTQSMACAHPKTGPLTPRRSVPRHGRGRSGPAKPLHAAVTSSKMNPIAREKAFREFGGKAMRQGVLVAAFAVAATSAAFAQGAPNGFNDTQREGLRLFSQSCGVCHTLVQQRTRQYGPVLSRETLGGDEELMREYISNGTPRMPGFRYYFEPEQISSIVQYIKTVAPPAQPAGAR